MNFLRIYIFFIIILCHFPSLMANVAVVESQYDKVEKALKSRKIKYEMIKYRDLEKKETFKKYKSIFIPCGIESSTTSNINVMSRGTRIKSVALKTNYFEIDIDEVKKNIKNFVNEGGYLYVSGYSYKYLQESFNLFKFFKDFPYIGNAGRIESNLKNDLYGFCLKDKMALYMTHSGWIAVKSAKDALILADAKYKTPYGEKMGPISLIINRGKGEILFTSYHSTVFSDFRRFNIYRIAGAELFHGLNTIVKKWEQDVYSKIADSIVKGENFRKYKVKVLKGENTIYFLAKNYYYQVDIFDKRMSILESRAQVTGVNFFEIKNNFDDYVIVKVYPSTKKRFDMFAIASASGMKMFPYFNKIIFSSIAMLVIIMGVFIYKLFNYKYAGKRKG